MTKNQAAWITAAKAKPFKVDEAPYPKPGPDEVVIKNAAVAINPVDWKIQQSGGFLKTYPNVLGTDIAGVVEEVGENVTHVKKGQRVIAHAVALASGDPGLGAFQLYPRALGIVTAPIPDSLSFEEAVVLPLAISTAAAGLFQKTHLNLPHPQLDPEPTGKTLLVWGGASSVGATTVQLATAAGLKVVSTASSKNHDFVKSLGAVSVVDYNSPNVVDDVIAAIKEAGGTFAGIYDAISEAPSLKPIAAIADKIGVIPVILVLPTAEAPTKAMDAKHVVAVTVALEHKDVGDGIWQKYVGPALAAGKLKAKPDPLVIGRGLDKIQAGLDKQQEGVSAKKVVVSL